MTINERLFLIMKQKGIKAKRIAEKLEIKESVISTWKRRNTDPPAKYIFDICKVLGISIYELLGVPEQELTKDEQELLNYFRNCNSSNKIIIINAAEKLQEPKQVEEEKSSTLKI